MVHGESGQTLFLKTECNKLVLKTEIVKKTLEFNIHDMDEFKSPTKGFFSKQTQKDFHPLPSTVFIDRTTP